MIRWQQIPAAKRFNREDMGRLFGVPAHAVAAMVMRGAVPPPLACEPRPTWSSDTVREYLRARQQGVR